MAKKEDQQALELEEGAEGTGDPGKRPNAPRGALSREDLAKKSDDEHENNEDFVDVADEDHDKLTEVSEEEKKEEPKKYKLKVNGKDLELTEEEMIAHVQKGLSADERFQEAARIKREAEEKIAQLPAKDVAKPKVTDEDLAKARALQMGSEEEAAEIIRGLRERPTLNEADVVRKIDERLTFQSSVERFKTEYPEVFSDPNLLKLVESKDQELVSQGDKRPYYDRYKSIGEEIRTWLGKVKPEKDSKQERKASITVLKTASGRAAGEAEEDIEESASDIISKMAKARGQGYAK